MKNNTALKPFKITSKVFFLSILAMLVCISVYIYLFRMVQTVGGEIVSLQDETSLLEAQQAEVGTLKKNLSATQASQETLSSYFIDANNIVPFLETVEGYGKSTNSTVIFNNVDIKHSPDELEVTLNASGQFSDLYRFIALLEAAPYEFSIKSIKFNSVVPFGLTPVGKGPHSTGWEANISLSVFSISGITASDKK